MLSMGVPQGTNPVPGTNSAVGSQASLANVAKPKATDSNLSALEANQEGLTLTATQESEVYSIISDGWDQQEASLTSKIDRFESNLSLAQSQSHLSAGNADSPSVQYTASQNAAALGNANRDYSYQYGQYLYQLAVLDPGSQTG